MKNKNTKKSSSNNHETPEEIYRKYTLCVYIINLLQQGHKFPQISHFQKQLDDMDDRTKNYLLSSLYFQCILIYKYKMVKAENPDKSNFQILKTFINIVVDDEVNGNTIFLPPPYRYKSGCLSKEDIEEIKNIILAVCMQIWLEYDKNSRQTISSFSHQKFLLKNEEKNINASQNLYIPPKTIDDNMRKIWCFTSKQVRIMRWTKM